MGDGARLAGATRLVLLALIGAACGLSTLAEGFYDLSVWGPIAVVTIAVALGLLAAGAARPRPLPAIAVGALGLLWLWSRISVSWAESADQAVEHAGRWALYAAALLALVLLMRRRSARWVPLAFATGGVVVVGLYVATRMAFGDGGHELFAGGRLRDPLGYVNGQAGYFLLGFWPCVALAEHARRAPLAGLGAAGAVVLGSLMVLSQARGMLPAVALSGLLVLAVVPGRARRVWALAAIGIVLLAIAGPLLDVYRQPAAEGLGADPSTVTGAGKRVLAGAVGIGVAWTLVVLFVTQGLARSTPARRAQASVIGRFAAAAAVVIALAGGLAVVGDPIERVSDAYDSFVNLRVETSTDSRFLSGGGYRYDYWRVAWEEFEKAPLKGLGAGNYDVAYFAARETNEDIRQPHSVEMQVLAELGLVGGLAFLAFVIAVLAGVWRTSRRAATSRELCGIAVAGGGTFVAWLVHTSFDWLHIMPGVTGIALCAAAGLIAPWSRRVPGRALAGPRIAALVVATLVAVAAADSIGRVAVADHYRIQGRETLDADPIEALRLANRALALNDESVPATIIRSAAYARLGNYAKAQRALRDAVALEPSDPLPWTLLGDLAVRRGDIPAAREAYQRALALNPRDGFLPGLVENPAAALPAP